MSRKEHTHRRPAVGGRPRKKRRAKSRWRTAATSDRYELYELAVQEPEAECDLVDQVWKERRGRKARHIREDFCGTAAVCAEWVKRRRDHTAIGVDLDPGPLEWGLTRSRKRLTASQLGRMKLIRADALTVKTKPVDSVLAMNFSYYIFKTREALRRYFKAAHRALVKDGLFLLDAYGGSDSFLEIEEDRNFDGFTYIWDQNIYNPITGQVINHIHFEFPDGTKIRKAFTYDWRLWTLPELQEALLEAGFKHVSVYWEGTDKKTGEGDGVWKISTRGEACQGWIAYLVAEK
jgi:SAM-dependent methyltransferase